MVMKAIRFVLGNVILGLNAVFSPTPMKRTKEAQAKVDQETVSLAIYELKMCPFCVKVRRSMKRLGLNIVSRDVGVDESAQSELMAGGRIDQVPCLRITKADGSVDWLYESNDIISYLENRFQASGV